MNDISEFVFLRDVVGDYVEGPLEDDVIERLRREVDVAIARLVGAAAAELRRRLNKVGLRGSVDVKVIGNVVQLSCTVEGRVASLVWDPYGGQLYLNGEEVATAETPEGVIAALYGIARPRPKILSVAQLRALGAGTTSPESATV